MNVLQRFASLGLGALAISLSASALAEEEKTVNFYNWQNYIDDTTLEAFTKETGIKVVYDIFDTNEILETKLLAGNSGFDVVVPGSDFMARQIKVGAFLELDKSKIPNHKLLDPKIMSLLEASDPGNRYGIPYMWGTTGIGYNVDKIKEIFGDDYVVDSWDFIFKPENLAKVAACGVAFLDNPTEIYATALNYLGMDPKSENPKDYSGAASDLIMKIRPHITYFHSSKSITDLANGDICVSVGWSGDVLQARDRAVEAKNGINIAYTIPKEGALMWLDIMTIPKDARHADAAYKLLNHLLKPEIMAKNSDLVAYANPVPESWDKIKPEVRNDPAIFPPEEIAQKLFVLSPHGQKVSRVITRSWARIRSGR